MDKIARTFILGLISVILSVLPAGAQTNISDKDLVGSQSYAGVQSYAGMQSYRGALTRAEEGAEFHRTSAQKGVETSTDVLVIAMPVATLAGVLIAQDWQGLKQGAFTAAATAGATLILKYAIKEERPDHSNMHSFPSGHSSVTFATAAFLQRRYGWKFGAPAYALATYTAWGRVFAKKHHWWDVVAGAAIGAGSAYIFTRPWARARELSIIPVTDGRTFGVTTSFLLF